MWLGIINKSNTFTPDHTSKPNPLNYGIHPIHHKKVTIHQCSKSLWQSYFTEFVLAQLKVKSKEYTQNHSSGINMRQTHSIHENNKATQETIIW